MAEKIYRKNNRDEQMMEMLLQRRRDMLAMDDHDDDPLEKESDEVGSKVASGDTINTEQLSSTNIQSQGKAEEQSAQMEQSISGSLADSKGGGEQMEDGVKSEMEESFGTDLGDVKIHTDSAANQMSEDINAKAFTHGNDIYFKDGNYDPSSKEGKELLGHELAHTQQQGKGVNRKIQRENDFPGDYPKVTGDLGIDHYSSVRVDLNGDQEKEVELKFVLVGDLLEVYGINVDDRTDETDIKPFYDFNIVEREPYIEFTGYEVKENDHYQPIANIFTIYSDYSESRYTVTVLGKKDFNKTGEFIVVLEKGNKREIVLLKLNSPVRAVDQTKVEDDLGLGFPKFNVLLGPYQDNFIFQFQPIDLDYIKFEHEAYIDYGEHQDEGKREFPVALKIWMQPTNGNMVSVHDYVPIYKKNEGLFSIRVLNDTGTSFEIDFDGDDIPEMWIFQYTEPLYDPNTEDFKPVSPENRKSMLYLQGPGLSKLLKFQFKIKDNYVVAKNYPETTAKYLAESDRRASEFLDKETGDDLIDTRITILNSWINDYLSIAASTEVNIIDNATYLAWREMSFGMLQLGLLISEKGNDLESYSDFTSQSILKAVYDKITQFFELFKEETKGAIVSNYEEDKEGDRVEVFTNRYTGLSRTVKREKIIEETSLEIDFFKHRFNYGLLQQDYLKVASLYEQWLFDQLEITKITSADPYTIEKIDEAQRTIQYRNELQKIKERGTDIKQIPAIFFPLDSAQQYEQGMEISELYVPLDIIYWKEGGNWYVRDIYNIDEPFTAHQEIQEGETQPPRSLFEELDHKKHLPKGTIYYKMPDGEVYSVLIEGEMEWYEYWAMAALILAGVALTLMTLGPGAAPVVSFFFILSSGASVISSSLALKDDYDHEILDESAFNLYALEIITSLLQLKIGVLGRFTNFTDDFANLSKVTRFANFYYMPLQATSIATEAAQMIVLTADAAEQIEAINNGPGTEDAKRRAITILISQLALTGGFFILSARGLKKDSDLINGRKNLKMEAKDDGSVVVVGADADIPDHPGSPSYTRTTIPDVEGVDPRVSARMGIVLGEKRATEIDNFIKNNKDELAEELEKYGTEAVYHAANVGDLDVNQTKKILKDGGTVNISSVAEFKKPTYKIGESDGGPGTWEKRKFTGKDEDAEFQKNVTGAPENTEYVVKGPNRSGEVKFDGYDPERNVLLDAKRFEDFPKIHNGKIIGKENILKEARRQINSFRNGAKIEWHVASEEKANLLRSLFRSQGIDDIEIIYPPYFYGQ